MSKLLNRWAVLAGCLPFTLHAQQCGGDERWAVKMGADQGAAMVNIQQPIATKLSDLVAITRPAVPSDDITRTPAEREVRVIDAHLVKFKQETGKTGDSDYHLVISDETLLYSAGGMKQPASPHSVIAEIPNPDCVGGRNGTVTSASRFQSELASVRGAFEQQFGDIKSGWNDAAGIRVRLTGVVFFDRPHGQVGRALNGLELHPLLAIEFNPTDSAVPPPPAVVLANPGFEDGPTGWTASADVITQNKAEAAHTGQWKAWLGGYGSSHSDKLWQTVTLPATTGAVSLQFYLHVDTEEESSSAFDKLRVRVRDQSGALLQTIATFSNLNAVTGYRLQSIDLSAFAGRIVRIAFETQEDNGSATSFVVDDVKVIVKQQL